MTPSEYKSLRASIERIHPSRLFGRHVGQRAGDDLWRRGRLTLARQSRGNAEAQQSDCAALRFDEDIGGLEIFVDEAAGMQARKRGRKGDGNAQELRQLQGLTEQTIQELTTRVGEHQHRAAIKVRELQRSNRPFRSEFVL
jgi:hypothetical protein